MCTIEQLTQYKWKITDPDSWGETFVIVHTFKGESDYLEVSGLDYVPLGAMHIDILITTLLLALRSTKVESQGELL